MPGLMLEQLPWPENRYRVDLESPGFETQEEAAAEDAKRAKSMRRYARKVTGNLADRLNALADAIDPKLSPYAPPTLASSRYLRLMRIIAIGGVWQLVTRDRTGRIERIDVIKPGWAQAPDLFGAEEPTRLRAELRADLLRSAHKLGFDGTANCKGFLFAVLHGERQAESGLIHPHYHVVATGDWVDIVLGMKKQRAYKPTAEVARPIRRRQKLNNLAYALTYLLKSYWPNKWRGYVSGMDTIRRRRDHTRIPEPDHSNIFLWINQFSLSQMVLKMGVHQTKNGLRHVNNGKSSYINGSDNRWM